MLNRFRLVILDYPKLTLRSEVTRRVLSDMLSTKQLNFERASEAYVSMNSQDMISTHYLIYDQTSLFSPKPVLAIRTCYENRARRHNLRLPIEDYIPLTPPSYQSRFIDFKTRIQEPIVDCNAHFVDEAYTYKATGINLSEIAYFALISFVIRKGLNNWVGATNERFKASRWAMKTGYCEDGLIFTHPQVPDPHKLLLMEGFKKDWLSECLGKYGNFVQNAIEITPNYDACGETLRPFSSVNQYAETQIPSPPITPEIHTA